MSKLRRHMGANVPSVVETKSLKALKAKTGNLYESIAIIAKRANQVNITIKEELHNKLEEFAQDNDFMTNFEQFGDNIRDRPKVGKSIGLVDYNFPQIDKAFLKATFQKTNARQLIENAKPHAQIVSAQTNAQPAPSNKSLFQRIKELVG